MSSLGSAPRGTVYLIRREWKHALRPLTFAPREFAVVKANTKNAPASNQSHSPYLDEERFVALLRAPMTTIQR